MTAVAIPHLDQVALTVLVYVLDALDGCGRGLEVERPRLPQRHPSEDTRPRQVPCLLPFGASALTLICGLEEMDRFGAHEVASRESGCADKGRGRTRGCGQSGLSGARDLTHRIHAADRDRIEGVCFGDEQARAVPLGLSSWLCLKD